MRQQTKLMWLQKRITEDTSANLNKTKLYHFENNARGSSSVKLEFKEPWLKSELQSKHAVNIVHYDYKSQVIVTLYKQENSLSVVFISWNLRLDSKVTSLIPAVDNGVFLARKIRIMNGK